MNQIDETTGSQARQDTNNWAQPVSRLKTGAVPKGAINLNVDGRQVLGPVQGFGQLWQKTFTVRLTGRDVTAAEIIRTWRENFPQFWPRGNRFYGSVTNIEPGEVAVLNLAGPAGMPLATGILVIYADEESFSFITPQGHMFAGWNTFSAFDTADGPVAQIVCLVRASDPLWEIFCRLGPVMRMEDRFWTHTLKSLAAHFGLPGAAVEQKNMLLDPGVQWRHARNVWHNVAIRSGLYLAGTPVRWVGRRLRSPRPG